MKIYIDFDDVICETAKHFIKLAKMLFGIELPYHEVQFFNLQKSFDLNDAQYDELMRTAHMPENLLAYEETPDASGVINKWIEEGHDISIITGRPFEAYDPSRRWLDAHGLERAPLFTVDKYGREKADQAWSYGLSLEEFYKMTFDFAIEDSPAAFEHVLHFTDCTVAVYDRPWNRQCALPNKNFVRCGNWLAIDKLLEETQKKSKFSR